MQPSSVAMFVGSLRKESYSRKMANALSELVSSSIRLEIHEIGHLPFYNQDLDNEEDTPAEWQEFRAAVRDVDGLLFVTPEYNRSVPAVLKNALDVGSRPYGRSVWNGKPGAIVSISPGAIGGFGANHHLRQALTSLNVPILQQPEAYIGGVANVFDENGRLINKQTEAFLADFLAQYTGWVHHLAGPASKTPSA